MKVLFSFGHFVKLLFCFFFFFAFFFFFFFFAFFFFFFVFLGRKKWLPHLLLWKYKEKDDV